MMALIWLIAFTPASVAESRVLLSIRNISTTPSPDFGTFVALPESNARAARSASISSLFPSLCLAVLSGLLISLTMAPAAWR